MTKKQRQKTSTLKLCSTLWENVSNEDAISQLLGKFTIDFMLNGNRKEILILITIINNLNDKQYL